MEILIAAASLVLGFVLLIKGADFFVEGSSAVAKLLRVPSIIIGLTIVAMGTSLPECAVSVTAAMVGNNALAVSNVVGSNIFNLMVVCGGCAVFSPLLIQRKSLFQEFPFSIFCGLLLLALGCVGMVVGSLAGALLLAIFAGYLLIMVHSALKARQSVAVTVSGSGSGSSGSAAVQDEDEHLPVWLCVLYIVGGMTAIKFGGDFVVSGASTVASSLGLSQNLIGLTIVAMGTSLPELVTSIVAARKGEVEMALGNVIGSNIFNILFVLGIAATLSPVAFITENIVDILLLTAMSVLVWFMGWTNHQVSRKEGMVMLGLYATYLVYICLR